MKKRMYVICVLLFVTLLGCNKEKGSYTDETTQVQQEETSQEVEVSKDIQTELGIGEDRMWKENITDGDREIEIRATLDIPDATKLYTMTVSEYYLTKKDKKRIAEYFMDADSIKVDKEMEVSKESLQQEIEWYEERIKEAQSPEGTDSHMIPLYESEKERFTAALANATSMEEMSEEAGDYSANAYLGTKNDIEYEIRFYADEERNRSAWSVDAITLEAFLDTDAASEDIICYNSHLKEQPNTSSMTKEEAEAEAVKLCQELGLPTMAVAVTHDLQWMVHDQQEYNGYVVTLARSIGGSVADNYRYISSKEWDGETTQLPYSVESVEVTLNDKGIIGVVCKGLLTDGELGEPVKLLSYDRIKDIFSKEVCGADYADITGEWNLLTLSYIKWESETNPDEYIYIPVWKLSTNGSPADMDLMMEMADTNIWINAIDGTRIDTEDLGSVSIDLQSMGDYE